MKLVSKVKFSKKEKEALKNFIETINCEGINCSECPFVYNCGCMLEHLRELIED